MGIDTGLNSQSSGRWRRLLVSLERETGIEPVSLAWKAKVLPLNYSRLGSRLLRTTRAAASMSPARMLFRLVEEAGFEPA